MLKSFCSGPGEPDRANRARTELRHRAFEAPECSSDVGGTRSRSSTSRRRLPPTTAANTAAAKPSANSQNPSQWLQGIRRCGPERGCTGHPERAVASPAQREGNADQRNPGHDHPNPGRLHRDGPCSAAIWMGRLLTLMVAPQGLILTLHRMGQTGKALSVGSMTAGMALVFVGLYARGGLW